MEGARAMKTVAKMRRRLPENGAAARRRAVEICPSISVSSTNSPSVTSTIDGALISSSSQSPEEQRVTVGESLPRVIFGGVPTHQEAREATSELSRAAQLFLASPNCVRFGDLATADKPPSSLLMSDSHLPSSAIRAFQLLNESPQVQNAVSSIVVDPNVWNAVIQNQEFQELLQSRNAVFADTPDQSPLNKLDTSSQSFIDSFLNLKDIIVALMDWMVHFSHLFKNLTEANQLPANDDGSPRLNHSSNNLVQSIIGLVVMVITMILVSRDT